MKRFEVAEIYSEGFYYDAKYFYPTQDLNEQFFIGAN